MNQLQTLRRTAYQRFGVFRAAARLSDLGVSTPSDQLAAVALFLDHGLGCLSDLDFVTAAPETVPEQLGNLLTVTYDQHKHLLGNYLRPLKELSARANDPVPWDPVEDFAELLNFSCREVYNRAAARLHLDLNIPATSVGILADQFVVTALPRALRNSFDLRQGRGHEGGWLERVFTRYARRVIQDDAAHRRQLQALREAGGVTEPEAAAEAEAWEQMLSGLPDLLERLPTAERRGLELYFGLAGTEHSIAQTAAALSCSEYHARAAVLHGLGRLASWLGVQGALDEEEYGLVRAFLGEGQPLAVAARHLKLSQRQARGLLGRAHKKLARALRPRTVPGRPGPRLDQPELSQEKPMPELAETDVLQCLETLHQEPLIRLDPETETRWEVDLGGGRWERIGLVRAILRRRPATLEALTRRQVPLGWLAIPDLPRHRAETLSLLQELEQELEELGQREFQTAQRLADGLTGAAAVQHFPLPDKDPDVLADRVWSVLGGVVQALIESKPPALRRRDEALLHVQRDEADALARWDAREAAAIRLGPLVIRTAALIGEFCTAAGAALNDVTLGELFDGKAALPGLSVEEWSETRVTLRWRSSSLEEESQRSATLHPPTAQPPREQAPKTAPRLVLLYFVKPSGKAVAQGEGQADRASRFENLAEGYDVTIYAAGTPGHSTVRFHGKLPAEPVSLHAGGARVEWLQPPDKHGYATVLTDAIRAAEGGAVELSLRFE